MKGIPRELQDGRWAARYPWQKWFKRKAGVTLEKGVDFECQVHGMKSNAVQAAYRFGVKIRCRIDGDTLSIICVGEREDGGYYGKKRAG